MLSPAPPCAAANSGVPCGGQRHDLGLAGALQQVKLEEAFADIAAGRQRAMVAQDHHRLGAKVGDQPLALVEVGGDAFIIVESAVAAHQHRGLGQR
jgi:hypothetical protein